MHHSISLWRAVRSGACVRQQCRSVLAARPSAVFAPAPAPHSPARPLVLVPHRPFASTPAAPKAPGASAQAAPAPAAPAVRTDTAVESGGAAPQFVIPAEHAVCKGCGVDLQTKFKDQPGFTPQHVIEDFLAKQDLAQRRDARPNKSVTVSNIEDYEEYMEELRRLAVNKPPKSAQSRDQLTCARCFQLTHYGHLRGSVDVAKPENFRALMQERLSQERGAVIIKLVDLFDFQGSFIPEFPSVVGKDHPVILVGNKFDLLPKGAGKTRIIDWLKKEAADQGLRPHHVAIVSSKDGEGVDEVLFKAKMLAVKTNANRRRESQKQRRLSFELRVAQAKRAQRAEMGLPPLPLPEEMSRKKELPDIREIYVVGTTNVGKSTLINAWIKQRLVKGKQAQPVTSSVIPGTTIGLVSFPITTQAYDQLSAAVPSHLRTTTLYDTPGVINPRQLSSRLTFDELNAVMPQKRVSPVTLRVKGGQAMLLGAFAQVEILEGQPFFFTAIVSRLVTIHVTDASRVPSLLERHAGKRDSEVLRPPYSADRVAAVGMSESKSQTVTVEGRGWDVSAVDIVFPGLGWIAVTGSGSVKLRVTPPKGVPAFIREPLMPFESKTKHRFTGSVLKRMS